MCRHQVCNKLARPPRAWSRASGAAPWSPAVSSAVSSVYGRARAQTHSERLRRASRSASSRSPPAAADPGRGPRSRGPRRRAARDLKSFYRRVHFLCHSVPKGKGLLRARPAEPAEPAAAARRVKLPKHGGRRFKSSRALRRFAVFVVVSAALRPLLVSGARLSGVSSAGQLRDTPHPPLPLPLPAPARRHGGGASHSINISVQGPRPVGTRGG